MGNNSLYTHSAKVAEGMLRDSDVYYPLGVCFNYAYCFQINKNIEIVFAWATHTSKRSANFAVIVKYNEEKKYMSYTNFYKKNMTAEELNQVIHLLISSATSTVYEKYCQNVSDKITVENGLSKKLEIKGRCDLFGKILSDIKESDTECEECPDINIDGITFINENYNFLSECDMWSINQFDFKKYKGKNVVIHCKTQEEAEQWCYYMGDNGLSWYGNETYSNNYWNKCKENTCYDFNKGLYNRLDYYVAKKYEVIEFSELIK